MLRIANEYQAFTGYIWNAINTWMKSPTGTDFEVQTGDFVVVDSFGYITGYINFDIVLRDYHFA